MTKITKYRIFAKVSVPKVAENMKEFGFNDINDVLIEYPLFECETDLEKENLKKALLMKKKELEKKIEFKNQRFCG